MGLSLRVNSCYGEIQAQPYRHPRHRMCFTSQRSSRFGATDHHRPRQRRPRACHSIEPATRRGTAHLCASPRSCAPHCSIFSITLRASVVTRQRLRTRTHMGPAQPYRFSVVTTSHAAYICNPLGTRRSWPRDHPRSSRSSTDHQHADLFACHRRRSSRGGCASSNQFTAQHRQASAVCWTNSIPEAPPDFCQRIAAIRWQNPSQTALSSAPKVR
jgi:hypothetical protein